MSWGGWIPPPPKISGPIAPRKVKFYMHVAFDLYFQNISRKVQLYCLNGLNLAWSLSRKIVLPLEDINPLADFLLLTLSFTVSFSIIQFSAYSYIRPSNLKALLETKVTFNIHTRAALTLFRAGGGENAPLRFFCYFSKNLQANPTWKFLTFPKIAIVSQMFLFYDNMCNLEWLKNYGVQTTLTKKLN